MAPQKFKHIQTDFRSWDELPSAEEENIFRTARERYNSGFPYYVENGSTFYIIETPILKNYCGDECSQAQNINFADTCPSKSKHPTSWFWLSKSKNKPCQYLSKLQKHLPWFCRWLLNWFKSRFSSRITSWPTQKKKKTPELRAKKEKTDKSIN